MNKHTDGVEIPDIKRTEINESQARAFESEADFIGLSVSLLIEAGSYICVAGNLYPADTHSWNRNEAILGGHLVRLYKLIDGLLDQTCKHRRETSFVLGRLAFECIVNLRYLIAHASDELFRSYRSYSLQHERQLLARIQANIEAKDGRELPIERRMINSIERSFRVSGIDVEDVPKTKERNWGGLNIFERAQAVGLEAVYLVAFGGGSHTVHGNWQDLVEYHLEDVNENSFRADFTWHAPRPQLLDAITLHAAQAVVDFAQYLAPAESGPFVDLLRDLQERVLLLSRLHEEFLSREKGDV
jgi:Family of unknown function (DUF5677)